MWTFTLPYLLNAPYANLGSKVGFIFGSLAVAATLYAYFFIPECKGRTLDEIDKLFNDGVSLRKFAQTEVVIEAETAEEEAMKKEDHALVEIERVDKV